jgi:predicted RNase H-like HicB family nuclease
MAKKASQYKVVIERDEDGFFVASVPALPGCHTQAKDIAQLMERVRDAILLCLEAAGENKQYRAKIKQFAYEPTFVGMDVVSI